MLQIANKIAQLSLKNEFLKDIHNHQWSYHETKTIWRGNQFCPQPKHLLSSRRDEVTGEECITIAPLGEALKPANPDQVYNSDEKPVVLNFLGNQNVVFGDEEVAVPHSIPQSARCKNVTLLITAQASGKLYTTIIFSGTSPQLEEALIPVLQRYCKFYLFILFIFSLFLFIIC